jgi:hypothetical protein
MMRSSTRLLVALLGSACACASASAALQATLPKSSGGRSWEIIAVDFPPVSGDVDVSVQDARGGPEIVRHVPGNAGRTWLPLPLEAPSDLSGPGGGKWPIRVVLRASDRVLEESRVELTLLQSGDARENQRLVSTTPFPGFDGTCILVPDQEILSAPALVFAGCDLVLLQPDLQARITRQRALELLAVGTRLAAPFDGSSDPPGSTGGGTLAQFLWERTSFGGKTMWTSAAVPLPRPAVIEPGLGRFTEGTRRQTVPAGITAALLLTGPLAMFLLVLQRGLFHRRRAVLASSALAMAALTAGVIVYLHTRASHQDTLAPWRQVAASDSVPVGGLMLEERLERCTALFAARIDIRADAGRQLFPVTATRDAYWSLRSVQLRLNDAPRLTGLLPARTTLYWESRSAADIGLLPPFPNTAADRVRLWAALRIQPVAACWLIGGYVKPADAPDEPGVLLGAWAADKPWATMGQPGGGPHRMAWYEMRFEPGHRYLLWPGDGLLNVADFGPPQDAPAGA